MADIGECAVASSAALRNPVKGDYDNSLRPSRRSSTNGNYDEKIPSSYSSSAAPVSWQNSRLTNETCNMEQCMLHNLDYCSDFTLDKEEIENSSVVEKSDCSSKLDGGSQKKKKDSNKLLLNTSNGFNANNDFETPFIRTIKAPESASVSSSISSNSLGGLDISKQKESICSENSRAHMNDDSDQHGDMFEKLMMDEGDHVFHRHPDNGFFSCGSIFSINFLLLFPLLMALAVIFCRHMIPHDHITNQYINKVEMYVRPYLSKTKARCPFIPSVYITNFGNMLNSWGLDMIGSLAIKLGNDPLTDIWFFFVFPFFLAFVSMILIRSMIRYKHERDIEAPVKRSFCTNRMTMEEYNDKKSTYEELAKLMKSPEFIKLDKQRSKQGPAAWVWQKRPEEFEELSDDSMKHENDDIYDESEEDDYNDQNLEDIEDEELEH